MTGEVYDFFCMALAFLYSPVMNLPTLFVFRYGLLYDYEDYRITSVSIYYRIISVSISSCCFLLG